MCGPVKKLASALGLAPEPPKLPPVADPAVAKEQAAQKASAVDLERRRKVATGGRQATILAGQQVAQTEQRKSLLGQ